MEQCYVSSTSTSENEFDSESPPSSYFGGPKYPVYPFAGRRPLVYNAHIQQDRRQRKRFHRKNPNCFLKAFRWYTQELPSPRSESTGTHVKLAGFAAWLDEKYEEFLCDRKCENNFLLLKSETRYITGGDNTIERAKQTSRKTKKFQRLKSPWKKKRHFTSDTERCALRETRSFKFILRPEDVSPAGSQCCQKSSCSKRSDATFVTSQITYTTKMKEKSHSAICITFEQPINVTNYDSNRNINRDTTAVPVIDSEMNNQNAELKTIKHLSVKNVSCACWQENSISPKDFKEISFAEAKIMKDAIVSEEEHKITAGRKRHTKVTVSCQCSVEDILKNICQCRDISRDIAPNFIPEKVECVQGDSYAKCCQWQKQPQQNLVASQKMDESNGNTSKYSSNLLKETVVQTSDHSITFEKDAILVKVLCDNKGLNKGIY